jgi:autotransporter-associated beta strand protein
LTLASYTSANTAAGETVTFTGSGNTFVTGAINPSATTTLSLAKSGAGTVTLSGTNTYTGATTVNDGKLVVNGSISTSVTTVASGATLGGSGTVRALTIDSGAFVTPGNSPGILTVNGAYTQAGQYTAEITGTTAGVGGYDQIGVTGTVDITGGGLVAMFSGAGYNEGDLFFILLNDSTDAITGTYTGFAQGATVATYGGLAWTISYNANANNVGSPSFTGGNDIALMAIPEPNVPALLGGLGALALLRRRRA